MPCAQRPHTAHPAARRVPEQGSRASFCLPFWREWSFLPHRASQSWSGWRSPCTWSEYDLPVQIHCGPGTARAAPGCWPCSSCRLSAEYRPPSTGSGRRFPSGSQRPALWKAQSTGGKGRWAACRGGSFSAAFSCGAHPSGWCCRCNAPPAACRGAPKS